MINVQSYELPSHWAHYLIDGETSGYTVDELDSIHAWYERTFTDHGLYAHGLSIDDSEWFSKFHDANSVFPYACNVSVFYFDVQTLPAGALV